MNLICAWWGHKLRLEYHRLGCSCSCCGTFFSWIDTYTLRHGGATFRKPLFTKEQLTIKASEQLALVNHLSQIYLEMRLEQAAQR